MTQDETEKTPEQHNVNLTATDVEVAVDSEMKSKEVQNKTKRDPFKTDKKTLDSVTFTFLNSAGTITRGPKAYTTSDTVDKLFAHAIAARLVPPSKATVLSVNMAGSTREPLLLVRDDQEDFDILVSRIGSEGACQIDVRSFWLPGAANMQLEMEDEKLILSLSLWGLFKRKKVEASQMLKCRVLEAASFLEKQIWDCCPSYVRVEHWLDWDR